MIARLVFLANKEPYAEYCACDLVRQFGIDAVADYYRALDERLNMHTFMDALADMLMFDALICNADCHFGNFGVLVDDILNTIVALAPLFNHGNNANSIYTYTSE